MITKSRTQGVFVALAAAAAWAYGAVPPAAADSSSSKVQARSGSVQQSTGSGTRGSSTRSQSTSSRATGTGSKVTSSSSGSSRGTDSRVDSGRGEDRKIPSRDQVDRGTPRYPRYHYRGYPYYHGYPYSPYGRGSFYFGIPYYGGWYHYGYPGDYYYRRPYVVPAHPRYDSRPGALDLDVSPERAEIFIDGERVGTADDFDGFPGYLWLESGTYDVVIYRDGFRTIARQITVRPGEILDIEDDMTPGEAQRPEELFATSTERRDDRLERDRERAERAAVEERWADERGYVPEIDRRYPGDDDESDEAEGLPSGVARIHFAIVPPDAAVYLDGHFVGTGEEISRLSAGLIVEPGTHTVEISRPGYRDEVREIEAEADDEVEIELELDRS